MEARRMASERRASILAVRGTYLALSPSLRLQVLFQGGEALKNPYAVIVVDPQRHPKENVVDARRLTAFLLQPATRCLIARFGHDRFSSPLFHLLPHPEQWDAVDMEARTGCALMPNYLSLVLSGRLAAQ
jgi:ABC-type tungstate transport system permease subunit